jgi:tRNA (adenine57-N1/adenine58-N1)-methyltransferase
MVENEFTDIESTEHIIRTIEAREGKTRHSFQGIGHTTYLCFARKAFFGRKSRKAAEKLKLSETPLKTTKKDDTKKTGTKKTTKKTSSKITKKITKKSA